MALFLVTVPLKLVEILPFSRSILVSGEVVDGPANVNGAVGATYATGVISFVADATAPELSVTVYL